MNVLKTRMSKEEIETIKRRTQKELIAKTRIQLKNAPFILKVLSKFCPSEAPALNAIHDFLKTEPGQKLTSIMLRGYDTADRIVDKDYDGAIGEIKETLNIFSLNDLGNIAREASVSINNYLEQGKGVTI